MLVLVLAAAACGPMVASAGFPARPETLGAGDLLGPFEGMVLDAETERPIEGALVGAVWAFERGVGLVGPDGAVEEHQLTASDGRYRVGRLAELPDGASARVSRFTLIVYKRGYVGWRSDGVFPVGTRRRDFSQRGNQVRLVKWTAEQSHARHLLFLGGGPQVQKAAAWEREPASLEMEGRATSARAPEATPLPGRAPALLDATALLTADEIRGVTGYAGAFEQKRLQDLPRTEFYDTIHFTAKDQPEAYDVALRLWRLGEVAAEQQYREVLAELPEPEARDEVGDTAVRVSAAGTRAIVFLLRSRGLITSITCGNAQCPDAAMVVKLAKLVESRTGGIPPLPAAVTPESEPGEDALPQPQDPFSEPQNTEPEEDAEP